jgi:ferredoxin
MTIKIDEKRCVLCGLCITQCPAGAFKGEGEHTVGQSRVFESIKLDNELCTECGECTAYQFWCPAEAIYDDSPEKTASTEERVERGDDGKKYSRLIFEYNEEEDPFAQMIPEDIPFNQIMRFNSDSFPVSGANFNWVQWIMPHDKPFLDIGHPPHIHKDPELLFHIGGDPNNPTELNSEVEFYLGVEMEKHVLTKSCVIYIPPNVVHSPWKPLYTKRPWIFIEVNQGPVHTEKGYHQCLKPEQWNSPDLMMPAFADDKY